MALSKVNFNSMNVTPAASKAIKFNSSNNGLETGDIGGSLVLISTTTISSGSSTVNITSGIDSTYKEYIIRAINVHPSANSQLSIHFSVDGGSNFNTNMTTTVFQSFHREDDSSTSLNYRTGDDIFNGTDEDGNTSTHATLCNTIGNDAKMCGESIIHLFNPSSTTFVKHFMARTQTYMDRDTTQLASTDNYCAGYVNTTSAVNAVSFRMNSGNIDSGTFKLYGVS